MRDIFAFFITIVISLLLITYFGSKRRKSSRYERSPYQTSDWQKLDRGIDPTDMDAE